ncbi:MAG: hypothetical protein ABH826_04970 [Patescibacteria group bacterium]
MKHGSKTFELFELMTAGFDEALESLKHPKAMLRYSYDELMEIKEARRRYERKRALMSLEKQKFVRSVKRGNEIFYKLTDRGWQQKLKNNLLTKKTLLPKGSVCFVSFDIPESTSHVRRALRLLLAKAEFYQVHRSVWEGRRDIVQDLKKFVRALKSGDWIHVYVGKKII